MLSLLVARIDIRHVWISFVKSSFERGLFRGRKKTKKKKNYCHVFHFVALRVISRILISLIIIYQTHLTGVRLKLSFRIDKIFSSNFTNFYFTLCNYFA